MICANGSRFSGACVKICLYRVVKYFKALRHLAVFSFVFSWLRRLKISKWIKFNLRQILRQRNPMVCNELCLAGLKT
jgi:hypothetical protein